MVASLPAPILILDFDETLVDADSSEWVAEQLGAASLFDELRWVQGMPWHQAMNVVLQTLHSRGVSIAQIRQAVSSLPLPPETVSALKVAHALGCELYIVSDANTFFIEVKLAHHGLDALFTQIHSNPAWIDAAGCLHYDDFHGHALPPHTCPLCPPNMCKGIILKSIQEAAAESATLQVIYAGDGAGDLCPTLWLNEGDHVLPRQGYPLSKLLFQHQVKARVHPWTTLADTLLDCVVSSDYDMQHNLNHVSSSLVLSAAAPAGKWRVLKGSAVTDACVRSMICCSESEKNPMSQWRRALVNCQSCSPTGSFRIHIATAKYTFSHIITSSLCKGGSAFKMYQAGFCRAGQAFQNYCAPSIS